MWFLILQIFLLLLIAAFCGGALVYWWMRGRYEDVTDSYGELHSNLQVLGNKESLTRAELSDEVASLRSAFDARETPDLSPLLSSLQGLERTINDKEPIDFTTQIKPLTQQVEAMSRRINQLRSPDLDPVAAKMTGLSARIAQERGPDLRPMEARLARIEDRLKNLDLPEPDLRPIAEQVRSLATLVSQRPSPDFAPVQQRMNAIEGAIAAIDIPAPDLTPLRLRLDAIEASLQAVKSEMTNPDDLKPVVKQIASLQEAFAGFPKNDTTPVINSIRSLDQKVESKLDLRALENRLTSIEYGLAAVHDRLRTEEASRKAHTNGHYGRSAGQPSALSQQDDPMPTFEAFDDIAPPSARPLRANDPINSARRDQDRANLLRMAAFGSPDDLTRISGVGPMLQELLNDIGVYYFWQIAEWRPEEAAFVDDQLLHFSGRIERDAWVQQAGVLAHAPSSAKRPIAMDRA